VLRSSVGCVAAIACVVCTAAAEGTDGGSELGFAGKTLGLLRALQGVYVEGRG